MLYIFFLKLFFFFFVGHVIPEKISPQDADTSVNTADLLSLDSHGFSPANYKIKSKSSLPIYSEKFQPSAFQPIATVHQTPFNSYQNTKDLEVRYCF